MAQDTNRPKPHLWEREIALLVQQSLLHVLGGEVSQDALSQAKYHHQTSSFRSPFYLRQYGGNSLLDQIVVEFSPKDDMFERRAALTMSVKDMEGHTLRTKIAENLRDAGFVMSSAGTLGYKSYTDGKSNIEVFVHKTEEDAVVSIRKT